MISKKTLLVLGAGSSVDVGLPLGLRLIESITSTMGSVASGNWSYFASLNIPINVQHIIKIIYDRLIAVRPESIDWFLNQEIQKIERGRDPDVATHVAKVIKTAIVGEIIEAENLGFGNFTRSNIWYSILLETIRKSGLNSLKDNQLRIVTFNYDRSILHFLREGLLTTFGPDQRIDEFMANLNCAHVYGRLGALPWNPSGARVISYGGIEERNKGTLQQSIVDAANNILTIHDSQEERFENEVEPLINENFKWADRIIFIGFGFHDENIKRLKLDQRISDKGEVYSTGYGLPQVKKNLIANKLNRISRHTIHRAEYPLIDFKTSHQYIHFGEQQEKNYDFFRNSVLLDDF